MKAFWNRFVHLILLTVVLVSLLVSLMILHPSLTLMDRLMHGDNEMNNNGPRVTQTNTEQSEEPTLAAAVRPESVVSVAGGQVQQTTATEVLNPVMKAVTDALTTATLADKDDKQTVSAYQATLGDHAPLIALCFSDQLSLSLLRPEDEAASAYRFNRLDYAIGDKKLYLINEDENEVYAVTLEKALTGVPTILDQQQKAFYPVEQVLLHNETHYLTTKSQTVATLRYIMERQSNSKLLNALFPAAEEIHDYSDTQMSRYFSGGHSLLVNNNDFQSEYREEFEDTSRTPDVVAAYKYLQRIQPENEMWLFSHYDEGQATCTFRRYINGLPVFGDHYVSRIDLSKPRDNTIQMQFSALSIQTPVTDLAVPMHLPAGKAVLAALNEQGYSNDEIEDLTLGYYWQSSEKSNRLIDLKPRWMVRLKGTYYALSKLIDFDQYPELQTTTADEQPVETTEEKEEPLEHDDDDLTRAAFDAKRSLSANHKTAAQATLTWQGPSSRKGETHGF